MILQPIVDGRKDVKFAEPIVQGIIHISLLRWQLTFFCWQFPHALLCVSITLFCSLLSINCMAVYKLPSSHVCLPHARSPVEISSSMDKALCKMGQDVVLRKKSRQKPLLAHLLYMLPLLLMCTAVPPQVLCGRQGLCNPPEEDSEPPIKATKQQQALYDIVRRFGNARSNNKHMNAIRE